MNVLNDYDGDEVSSPSGPNEYGSLDCCPDDVKEFCEKIHDTLTIKQLNALCDFFSSKASKLRDFANDNVTIEQFEKAKKEDIDGDNEEGE